MGTAPPFLISASRRTDIPAFYGEWFRRRRREGWCETANPFSGKIYRVSLREEDTIGWIFWSRNYAPFLDTLSEIHKEGGRFLCHFTIIGYPGAFEPRTPPAAGAVKTARRLAAAFGPDVTQWRYDPVVLSSATPPEWHLENFASLAGKLRGSAKRCYFSFPTMYRKTIRNLDAVAANHGIRFWSRERGDFTDGDLAALARGLASLARENGMETRSCCGEKWVDPEAGILKARCVDWPLLRGLLPDGEKFKVPLNPSRAGCGCYKSVDIGRYHTCAHGCAYCYAVDEPERARENLRSHNPDFSRL